MKKTIQLILLITIALTLLETFYKTINLLNSATMFLINSLPYFILLFLITKNISKINKKPLYISAILVALYGIASLAPLLSIKMGFRSMPQPRGIFAEMEMSLMFVAFFQIIIVIIGIALGLIINKLTHNQPIQRTLTRR